MTDLQAILIERGHGRRAERLTIRIPSNAILGSVAMELKRRSGGIRGVYGECGCKCVGVYRPIHTYWSEQVSLISGVRGPRTERILSEDCIFYYFDGELTCVAFASFTEDGASVRLTKPLATEEQLDLFGSPESSPVVEGAVVESLVTRFERDPALRAACLRHHGSRCVACGVDLADVYGPVASGLVHVHHLDPLAAVRAAHTVDPRTDLVPVCPNCHAVVHRRTPPFTPQEIRSMLHCDLGIAAH